MFGWIRKWFWFSAGGGSTGRATSWVAEPGGRTWSAEPGGRTWVAMRE